MELTGTIKKIFPIKTGVNPITTKQWKKQEFLVVYKDGMYEREVLLQVMGEKIDLLKKVGEGETVNMKYNIESRYHSRTDSYFTNVTAWTMDPVS